MINLPSAVFRVTPGPRAAVFRALLASASFSLLSLPQLLTAAPTPAKPDLLLDNGNFARVEEPVENLWDGVESTGALSGFKYSPDVLNEDGSFQGLAMPPSVAYVDLNGDGKPDLVTADPAGFFRFYPNVGSATEPKFVRSELVPIFVSSMFELHTSGWGVQGQEHQRMCPRFSLADWRHSGLLDLVIGNYYGELFFLPNMGSTRQPVFQTPVGPEFIPPETDRMQPSAKGSPPGPNSAPVGINAARVPTHDNNRYWGNLFSPVACSWGGGTGRPDVLLGEGTYSANAIHCLLNVGSDSKPKFSNTKHTMIAYGDGREQLNPTVADFNGDGFPDLVVSDRTGEVGLYFNPGKPNPGLELKRTSTLSFGGTSKLPGVTTPYAADYNGDGLVDLIFGLPNGHIAVALNTGSKTEPQFGPLQDIQGTPKLGKNVKLPSVWKLDLARQFGHALSYFTVVNAQDDPEAQVPGGMNALKAGYWPVTGLTFPMPENNIYGTLKRFTFVHEGLTLNANKQYKLTFKVKAEGISKVWYELFTRFVGRPDKLETDERGGVKAVGAPVVDELLRVGGKCAPTSKWTTIEAPLDVRYKTQSLRNEPTIPMRLIFEFYGTTTSSKIYFADMHLVEQ